MESATDFYCQETGRQNAVRSGASGQVNKSFYSILHPPASPISVAPQIYAANLAAIRQMRGSDLFKRTLHAVLAAGNFLNHGSRLGGALGFRLKALPKLADTKSADAKTSLLQVGGGEALCRISQQQLRR